MKTPWGELPARRLRRLGRERRSITLELFAVMVLLLVLSLAVVVVGSGRFLRATGTELAADQAGVARDIIESSVAALEKQGEESLLGRVRDKAGGLDQSLEAIQRMADHSAADAERLLAGSGPSTSELPVLESRLFATPSTRPADFGPESSREGQPALSRSVSLGTAMWHRAPGADPAQVAADLERLSPITFTLRALYRENPLSSSIYLGTRSGLFLDYPADASIEKDYDPRKRDWYQEAIKEGKRTWSAPYVDTGGALIITCSRPIHRPGTKEPAGVVAVDVTLEQLNRLLGELESGGGAYAFVLDPAGRIITSPELRSGATRWDQVFETENLVEDEKDPALAAVAKRMTGRESGLVKLSRPDGEKYLAFHPIPSAGWSLGVLVPVQEIVEPALKHEKDLEARFDAGRAKLEARVDEARYRFLRWGMVGTIFLLVWTTGFVYVRLTEPLQGFIRDIQAVARGNLEHKVTAPHENELADLAQAFNDMTAEVKRGRDQIEEYSRTLERKVEARTAELAASNAELADAIRRLQDAQTRLVHSEKMASLGQLVAGIAHEINNPVNFIANSVGPLQSALEDLARVSELYETGAGAGEIARVKQEIGFEECLAQMRRALELIKTGASRTRAIVLQLRNFSRLDEAEMKEADLHEGLDGSLALLNYRLKDKVEVVREYGNVGRLTCYPGQLNQVFMNILVNAVQAIETRQEKEREAPPGKIVIATRREPDRVLITITDNGTGIPESALGKIFDPFFTTKDRERGTGLGLSISHGIVEKHGGRIDVSTELGKGTTFVITLPAALKAVAMREALRRE